MDIKKEYSFAIEIRPAGLSLLQCKTATLMTGNKRSKALFYRYKVTNLMQRLNNSEKKAPGTSMNKSRAWFCQSTVQKKHEGS